MIPDLASVMRKRYRMERTLKFIAVLLVVVWMIFFAFNVVEIIRLALTGFGRAYFAVGILGSTPMLIGAVFLGLLYRRLTNWILPIPRSGCPRCGYRLIALTEPRCPECGLTLPREMIER